jgi:hypothetical protein
VKFEGEFKREEKMQIHSPQSEEPASVSNFRCTQRTRRREKECLFHLPLKLKIHFRETKTCLFPGKRVQTERKCILSTVETVTVKTTHRFHASRSSLIGFGEYVFLSPMLCTHEKKKTVVNFFEFKESSDERTAGVGGNSWRLDKENSRQ